MNPCNVDWVKLEINLKSGDTRGIFEIQRVGKEISGSSTTAQVTFTDLINCLS